MTATKPLPARPSLESLRKEAKKLARDVAAGAPEAIERARAQLPNRHGRLTQRKAQLVIAREYGFAGWQELAAEVGQRLGADLEPAIAAARRAIHDDDVERLRRLVAEHPALLDWQAGPDGDGLLGIATSPYAFDVGSAQRERDFTRAECAELLLDLGAVVAPSVCETILQARAKALLALFQRKRRLPRELPFVAALGDVAAVRAALAEDGADAATVNEAFVRACLFDHEAVAVVLLDRCSALDTELGTKIDAGVGRAHFVQCFTETRPERVRKIAGLARAIGLWKTFVIEQVSRSAADGDVAAFATGLRDEPWLLGDAWVDLQSELMGSREPGILRALLELDPAILRRRPPPSRTIEQAFMHGNKDVLPLLTRIWPIPDDLPFAAGRGDLARVRRCFDGAGAIRDLQRHYPYSDPDARSHLRWDPPTAQHVLDVAFAFAVINGHFDVADFLLERGANVNTDWNSHEPASVLHFLVFQPNPYEAMQYLIDRGIDMTIRDYRWSSNAAGWARFGNRDERMAQWLEDAERRRGQSEK